MEILLQTLEGTERGSLTRFARKLGKSPSYIKAYIDDPNRNIGVRLANEIVGIYPSVNKEWLLYDNIDKPLTTDVVKEPEVYYNNKIVNVPVIGNIECGIPITSQLSNAYKVEFALKDDVKYYNNPFFLVAQGDSMRPYINPGDKLLCVDAPHKIKNRTAVVVSYKTTPDNYEANAKLYFKIDEKNILLYSINTKFPPEMVSVDRIYYIYKVIKIIREVK